MISATFARIEAENAAAELRSYAAAVRKERETRKPSTKTPERHDVVCVCSSCLSSLR